MCPQGIWTRFGGERSVAQTMHSGSDSNSESLSDKSVNGLRGPSRLVRNRQPKNLLVKLTDL